MPGKTTRIQGTDTLAALSRIGQRRQVVIPKRIFEQLALSEGDFMEVTVEHGRVAMQPKKLVDADDTLSLADAKKVRHGLQQLKKNKTKPWSQIKHELDL